MLQVYTGEGKGKSTAAFGSAMRAAGQGLRVRIIQFVKGSTFAGELVSAEKLGIEVFSFGRSCPYAGLIKTGSKECDECARCCLTPEVITEEDKKMASLAWQLAQESVLEGNLHLLILDEAFLAMELKLLPLAEVLLWLEKAALEMEIILTGRNAPPEIIAQAHLVSRIYKVKHPFDTDMHPRRGIEY